MRTAFWIFCTIFLLWPGPVAATDEGPPLSIHKLRLFFVNHRSQITVSRNDPGPKASAELLSSGTGLLQGYWQVDGRIISRVNRHLTGKKSITIKIPEPVSIPTFADGAHILAFTIRGIADEWLTTRGVYYVSAAATTAMADIRLERPTGNATVYLPSTLFTWHPPAGCSSFLIEFIQDDPARPVAAAFVLANEYRPPLVMVRHQFTAGTEYFWQVKGFGADHRLNGSSRLRPLRIRRP